MPPRRILINPHSFELAKDLANRDANAKQYMELQEKAARNTESEDDRNARLSMEFDQQRRTYTPGLPAGASMKDLNDDMEQQLGKIMEAERLRPASGNLGKLKDPEFALQMSTLAVGMFFPVTTLGAVAGGSLLSGALVQSQHPDEFKVILRDIEAESTPAGAFDWLLNRSEAAHRTNPNLAMWGELGGGLLGGGPTIGGAQALKNAPRLSRIQTVSRFEALQNVGVVGRSTLAAGDAATDRTRQLLASTKQKVSSYMPRSKTAIDEVVDTTEAELTAKGPMSATSQPSYASAMSETVGRADPIPTPVGYGNATIDAPIGAGVFNSDLGAFTPAPLGARNADEAVRAMNTKVRRVDVAGVDDSDIIVKRDFDHTSAGQIYDIEIDNTQLRLFLDIEDGTIGHIDVFPVEATGMTGDAMREWKRMANTMGSTRVRQVARRLFRDNPDMTELRGLRVTGATSSLGARLRLEKAIDELNALPPGREAEFEAIEARIMKLQQRIDTSGGEQVIPRELFHSLWGPVGQQFRDYTLFPLSNKQLVRSNAIPLLPWERARDLRQVLDVPTDITPNETLSSLFDLGIPARPHRTSEANRAKALEALENLFGSERVNEALPSAIRDMQSGHGLTAIRNIQLMYGHIDPILTEISERQGAWWRKILGSRFGKATKLLPFSDFIASLNEYRLSPMAQMAGTLHDNFVESIGHQTLNLNVLLKEQIDNVFRPGTLPAPRTKQTKAFFQRISELENQGVYSREQAHMWRVAGILEEPKAYNYKGAAGAEQRSLSNGVQRIFNDQRLIESRQFGIDIAEVNGAYIPHTFKFDNDLISYDGEGLQRLTAEAQNKIFGTKQFFAKTRTFPTYRMAMLLAKEPLQFADGVVHPADIVTQRVQAGGRMIADRMLTGEMKLRDVPKVEQDLMKHIKGGRPGRAAAALERVATELRAFKFGTELAALFVQGPSAYAQLIGTAPAKAPEKLFNALNMLVNPAAFNKWTVARSDLLGRFTRGGGHGGIHILETGGKRSFVERPFMPSIKIQGGRPTLDFSNRWNPIKALNDAQFSRFVTYLKVETFALLTERNSRNSPVRQALGAIGVDLPPGIDPVLADRAAAAHVDEIMGGIGNTRRMAGPDRLSIEKMFDITPNFFNATISQVNRAFLGGKTAEAALARNHLLKLFGLAMATTAIIEKSTTGDWPAWENKLDPDSEEFLRAKTNTDIIQPMGRWGTLFRRLYASPARDAIQIAQGETDDLRTPMELQNLVRGRLSIPLSTIRAFTEQRDFLGEALFTDEGPGLNWTTASVLGDELIMPISADQILTDLRNNEATRLSLTGVFFGINSFPLDQEREAIRNTMVEELVRMYGASESSARDAVMNFAAFEARDANGNLIQVSPADKSKLYEQVAIRLGYTDKHGRPTAEDIAKVRRFASDYEFTNQELATIEQGELQRFFEKQEIETQARIEAYDSISQRFVDGQLTLGDVFSEISTVNRAFRLYDTVNDEVYADLLDKLAEWGEDTPRSEKEMFFLNVQAKLDETVRPDGSIDYDRRRDILNATQAALGPQAEQWWDEFQDYSDSRNDLYPSLVRTYYEMQDAVRPYFEAKYDVLEGRDLALYNRWEAAADDPAVQRGMLVGPDGPAIARAKLAVENRQRQYLMSDLSASEPDPPLQTNVGGKRMVLALWLLFGTGGTFGAAGRPDLTSMIQNLAPGKLAPRQAVGEAIATQDLSFEDLMAGASPPLTE